MAKGDKNKQTVMLTIDGKEQEVQSEVIPWDDERAIAYRRTGEMKGMPDVFTLESPYAQAGAAMNVANEARGVGGDDTNTASAGAGATGATGGARRTQ